MAKRQTNRKITIRFTCREPKDPRIVLEAVEEVFRPKEVDIEVGSEPNFGTPDEQLESQMAEEVRQVLDNRDREIKADNKTHQVMDPVADVAADSDMTPLPESSRLLRQRVAVWMARHIPGGWTIVMKVLEALEKLSKITD